MFFLVNVRSLFWTPTNMTFLLVSDSQDLFLLCLLAVLIACPFLILIGQLGKSDLDDHGSVLKLDLFSSESAVSSKKKEIKKKECNEFVIFFFF